MIHPRPNWRRRGITASVAIAAVLQFAPSSAGAVEVAGLDEARADQVASDRAADGENRRFRLLRVAQHLGLDADALVDLVRDRAGDEAADRLADRLADRPTDRPTDKPTDRPADRPTDRPTDRPSDRPDVEEREDVFPIGQIGRAHLAWNANHVRVVEVGFVEGWKHRVVQDSREKLAIHFTDGTSCGVFTAGLRPDGLHTDVSRHDCPDDHADVRTETFAVGDIGKVTLAWTKTAIRIQDVASADGWKHRQHQEHRGKVLVAFTDGEQCVRFTAVLTDDGLKQDIERRPCPTDRPTTDRPATDRPTTDTVEQPTARPVEANATRG